MSDSNGDLDLNLEVACKVDVTMFLIQTEIGIHNLILFCVIFFLVLKELIVSNVIFKH